MHYAIRSTFMLWLSLSVAATPACVPRQVAHSAPGTKGANVRSDCGSGYAVVTGPYRYENNQWGSGKARGRFEQCLLTREEGGQKVRGWTWSFPGSDPSVFSYPEIIFGWKPWSGGKTTDPHLPTRVGDFKKLRIVYDVESEISGSYNLAPEVWITSRSVRNGPPAPGIITAEVMFWMDSGGIARPGGTLVDTVVISGEPFELWQQDGANASGESGNSWRLISFKREKPQLTGMIDIPAFMRALVERQLVDPQQYISTVEFGNEVTGGSGTTWVKHFEVQTE